LIPTDNDVSFTLKFALKCILTYGVSIRLNDINSEVAYFLGHYVQLEVHYHLAYLCVIFSVSWRIAQFYRRRLWREFIIVYNYENHAAHNTEQYQTFTLTTNK